MLNVGQTFQFQLFNELHNREMHISGKLVQSATSNVSKHQNGTLKVTIDELSIIKILLSGYKVTQKKIAELTGAERTVKRKTVEIQQKGFIARENGKRNGRWIVKVDMFRAIRIFYRSGK